MKPSKFCLTNIVLVIIIIAALIISLAFTIHFSTKKSENQDLTGILTRRCSAIRTVENKTSFAVGLLILTNDTNNFQSICSCTLITKKRILTAAHCFDGFRPSDVTVTFGTDLNSSGDIKTRLIKSWKMHEKYNRDNLQYDIAIAELNAEVQLEPICLHGDNNIDYDNKYDYENTSENICGEAWGWTHCNNNSINHKALVKVVTITECDFDSNNYSKICTLGEHGPCRGDSGGPLLLGGRQIGVISGGYNNGNKVVHSTFSIDWIAKNLDDNTREQFLKTQMTKNSFVKFINYLAQVVQI